MYDLSGRRALVTGATGGIGGAIAQALQDAGARVAISGTREEKLAEVAREIGGETVTLPCDLGDSDAVGGLVAQAAGAMGGVDILVNNAGITRDNLAMRMKDEEWDQVLAVNLTAAFRLTKAALRGMMKARWGRVISVTSVVGTTGNAGQANYAASKAGIAGWTKSVAQEVASRGVTLNCIAPGFIETPMTDALDDAQRDKLLATIPAARFGKTGDVAAAAVFLASDEAGYITGQTLHVNGGMAMI